MSYGNQGYRTAPSPFANSIRQPTSKIDPSQFGLGGLLEKLQATQRQEMVGSLSQGTPDPMPMDLSRPAQLRPARPEPVNPFAENEQYQALMEYQKSMAPSQEQQDRLSELRTAFEGTAATRITVFSRWNSRCNVCVSNLEWEWVLVVCARLEWECLAGFRNNPSAILTSRCPSRVADITNLTESRCSSQTLCSSLTRTTMGVMVCSRPRSSNIKCRSHNISRIKTRISRLNRSRNNSVVMEWVKAWVDMAVTAVCRTRISHSSLVNKV